MSASTRARVLKAIEELKYSPNLHARSLAGGKSRSIGVIVSNIENPFFLDIYKTVDDGALDVTRFETPGRRPHFLPSGQAHGAALARAWKGHCT